MAVLRENNWLGQQRLDIPQLRSIESQVRGDFDLLVGTIFAGKVPAIVRGFELTATTLGSPAASIEVVVANSISTNFNATESGSMFVVPAARANEVLSSLNAKVIGSFTASATNYVGMDIRRTADALTSDILQFLNATTLLETSRTVPLGRTLDYRFIVSTSDFSSRPNIVPIAIVATDASNNITIITDARNLVYRLAPGGSFASIQGGYGFPGGRSESTTALDMTSGDKAIDSQFSWMKAAMTRIQEIGGGEFWYSATADRNVTMIWDGGVFSNGENFEVVSGHLHWRGIKFIFDNSTGYYNKVADRLTDLAGLTDLVNGECIYVDLDRTQNLTGGNALSAQKAVMSSLGPGSVPGARNIIAWMQDGKVYTRQSRYPVGSIPFDMIPATTTANGLIRISRDYLGNVVAGLSGLNTPTAISDRGGTITAVAASNHTGLIVTGNGTGNGGTFTAGATGTGLVGTGSVAGVVGNGTAAGPGVWGTGGPSGAGSTGVRGKGGAVGGRGGDFEGTGAESGVYAQGGPSDGDGISAFGGGANGRGGSFAGTGSAQGVAGFGATGGGAGVQGTGHAVGGGSGGEFAGSTANGKGLTANGGGTGSGAVIAGGPTNGKGLEVNSTGSGTAVVVTPGATGDGIEVNVGGTGRGLDISSNTGEGARIESTANRALYAVADGTAVTARIENGAGNGVPLEVVSQTGGTQYKVVTVTGPVPPAGTVCTNSINVANITRAWVELPNLASPILSTGVSHSVTSVTASAAGRVIVTFPASTFPTANYTAQITFWDANSGGSSGTVIAPIIKQIGKTATTFTFDIYSGLGTNTLINLPISYVGISIVFTGCGS